MPGSIDSLFGKRALFFLLLTLSLTGSPLWGEMIGNEFTTRITSDEMISQENPKILHFIGNVKAFQEGIKVKSGEIKVFYGKQGKGVKKIVATGDVQINSATRIISGGKAEIYPKEKKVIVSGNAAVKEDGEEIKGEKIIYFYERDDIIIMGGSKNRAKMLFTPKKTEK